MNRCHFSLTVRNHFYSADEATFAGSNTGLLRSETEMLQLYPADAVERIEFDKIKALLHTHCRTASAHRRVDEMRIMSRLESVEKSLRQTAEFKNVLGSGGAYFPSDFTADVERELKLLSVTGAVLGGEQLVLLQALAINIKDILNWFKNHSGIFPYLQGLTEKIIYEKEIPGIVSAVLDESGTVRDNASAELLNIRRDLASTRSSLRRTFEGVLRRLGKAGYLADISEGYHNGRRTVAVMAEHKRIVKGILHGESDTSKTVFIEPEETIEGNNEVYSLERAEAREIQRILASTTALLQPFALTLGGYYHLTGLYDFIRAKALLAADMGADLPILSAHPGVHLVDARHPLLLLRNKRDNKPTIPLNISLNRKDRVLIISGPNAGGKTVSMKTVGLLQIMAQAGLLIPAAPQSEVGIFRQLFIHIGDTQSIEHELSTYSAHLRDMKHFMDFANGKTLFFIDELGSGSDPALGGAFAEAIVEELAARNALGIITTHYLNLKVMAGKTQGIYNGAMLFDEENLEPLYTLTTGKPGSSYTFAIAQRTGLPDKIIDRAKALTERGHFKLDKVLHQTEQQAVRLGGKEKDLDELLHKNERLKDELAKLIDKERLRQHFETLRLQNKIKKEELEYLRETERKFKQIIQDWKKAENKDEVIDAAEKVLFRKKAVQANAAAARKADKAYDVAGGKPQIGDLLRNKTNHQVGTLTEIRGERGFVKIGKLPFNVELGEWVVVRRKS